MKRTEPMSFRRVMVSSHKLSVNWSGQAVLGLQYSRKVPADDRNGVI